MNFVYAEWIGPLLITALAFCYFFWWQEKRIQEWVNKYWFFKQSSYSKWTIILFSCSTVLLFLSMADLRGEAKKH